MRMFRYEWHGTIYLDFWLNESRWMYLNTKGKVVNENQGIHNSYLMNAEEIIL